MLQEYSLSYRELLNLHPKQFWFLLNQIERLRAEKDLRRIAVLTAAAGSMEHYKATTEALQKEIGRIYVWEKKAPKDAISFDPDALDPDFDREGLRALKQKLAARD